MTTKDDALKAVLLFHSGREWNDEARAEWLRLTGREEATTKALCDTVRDALSPKPCESTVNGKKPPSEVDVATLAILSEAVNMLKLRYGMDAIDTLAVMTMLAEAEAAMARHVGVPDDFVDAVRSMAIAETDSALKRLLLEPHMLAMKGAIHRQNN